MLYFDDAPTLVGQLATLQAPAIAWIWIGILTFTTYVLAGFMREQVCVYMCPWPRIQAAMTDENALNVTYRCDRGEQRMSLKKATAARALGEPAGDCIDCNQCVAVCPTGVDIRDGANLGCIQCGLCIDACDAVMEKIGRPPRLIAYDTEINIDRRRAGKPRPVQADPGAHHPLCRGHRFGRRRDDGGAGDARRPRGERDPRPQSDVCEDRGRLDPQRLRDPARQPGLRTAGIRDRRRGAETPRLQAIGVESDPDGRRRAGRPGPDARVARLTATPAPARGRPTSQDIEFRIDRSHNGETAIAKDHFEAP